MAKETNEATAEKKAAKPKKEKKKGKVGKFFKETFSELKKVTWPSFGTVVKQTGIVLAVVVIFLVVLMCFDQFFGWLYGLLVKGINAGSETSSALAVLAAAFKGGVGLPLWV